jgi:putative ABC transport system ATP-binding protein
VTLIQAVDVGKTIRGVVILAGVDVRVDRGESVAVTGPSGSGKSTLMAVLGLLTSRSGGCLWLDGAAVPAGGRGRRRARRRQSLAWVPQTPLVLPGRSALDNALLGARLVARPGAGDVDAALTALRHVGLEHAVDRDATALSGGELQRLGVARALVGGARLVMADEPTASLDRTSTARVVEALRAIHGQTTLLVATHDQSVAEACDRVLVLHDGRLVAAT